MVDPKQHSQHRKLVSNDFTENSLKRMEPLIARNTQLAVTRMQDAVKKQGYCDVLEWFSFMATDVVQEAAFGESSHTLQTGKKDQLTKDLELAGFNGVIRSELPILSFILNLIPIGVMADIKGAVPRTRHYAENSLQRYGRELRARPDNMKPTLFDKYHDAVESGVMRSIQMVLDAVDMIIAGTDTTAQAATYAVWHLSRLPDSQRKVIEEVTGLPVGFDDTHLKTLKHLNDVINETLRLRTPISQALPRVVPSEGAELCEYFVPQGTIVGIQAYSIHRNPVVWPDPERFDPSRWDNVSADVRDNFLPFGGGSRICIGMHFAYTELRYALANFYRTFDRGMKPASAEGFTEEEMRQMSFFMSPPEGKRCLVAPV